MTEREQQAKLCADAMGITALEQQVADLTAKLAAAERRVAELRKEADAQRELADRRDWRFREEEGKWLATRDVNQRVRAELTALRAANASLVELVKECVPKLEGYAECILPRSEYMQEIRDLLAKIDAAAIKENS